MPSRSVLVSYLPSTIAVERNKVVSILKEADQTDIEYLKDKCMVLFSLGSNINITMTFLKFDKDWDCFIDLEDDYVTQHKDKLRLVVTPCLWDCSSSPSLETADRIYETVETVSINNFYLSVFFVSTCLYLVLSCQLSNKRTEVKC